MEPVAKATPSTRASTRGCPFERLAGSTAELAATLALPGADEEESKVIDQLVPALRRWARKSVDDAEIDQVGRIPPEVLRGAADLGLFGLTIPNSYGGAGLSFKGAGHVLGELARFDRSLAVTIGLHCAQGTQSIACYGSEELKRLHLPRMASGATIGAFALTEPDVGSDLAALRTRALLHDDGTVTVEGEKAYVTNAGIAELFTVLARVLGRGGHTRGYALVLVDRGIRGVHVGAEERKLGLRGSSTCSLHLDGVRLPHSRILGNPLRGHRQLSPLLAMGRILMSAGCVGSAREAVNRAVAYAQARPIYGMSLADLPVVAGRLETMRSLLFQVESAVQLTGQLVARDGVERVQWESAVSKVLASEAAWEIVDRSLQMHGGAGFIEDTGIGRMLRDVRVGRIFEGSNELLREAVRAGLHGLTRRRSGGSTLGAELARRLSLESSDRVAALQLDTRLETLRDAVHAEPGDVDGLQTIADRAMGLYADTACLMRRGSGVRDGAA